MTLPKEVSPEPGETGQNVPRIRNTLRACSRCRSLHKKCDIRRRHLTCSQCEVAGVACEVGGSGELRFRFAQFRCPTSTKAQNASSISNPQLKFQRKPPHEPCSILIRTEDRASQPEVDSSITISASGHPDRSTSFTPWHAPSLENSNPKTTPQAPASTDSRSSTPTQKPSSSQIDNVVLSREVPPLNVGQTAISGRTDLENSDTPNPTSHVWPLGVDFGVDEAELVKHFFTILLPWFDYCWADAPFRSYISEAMYRDAGILYAILAVSARHLEATCGIGYCNSNEYEQECLGILIPTLSSNEATRLQGNSVLVSALLLRLLDEMTDPADSPPIIRHTVSAPLFQRISQHNFQSSMLRNAAMAIALRQEIHIANVTKRPVELTGDDCGIENVLKPASDVTWTRRIMAHAARVTNFAYGGQPRSDARWDQLWQYIIDWDREKPYSFCPLTPNDKGTRWAELSPPPAANNRHGSHVGTFPKIYYVHDCPVASHQYLEICKMVLLAHDPRTPGLGPGRVEYVRAREEQIREAVRTICGIWLCNREHTPARVLAGLAIGMAGELFTDVFETGQLLEIMTEAELHVGWPCLKVSPRLRSFWASETVNT